MSRSTKRNIDDLEALRRENKELRAIIKSLERELKKLNKEYKQEYSKAQLEQEQIEERNPKCSECGKGEHKIVDLGPRKIVSCSICTYRKVLKNGTKKKNV